MLFLNLHPHDPVTTKSKDHLISVDTFGVVESELKGELMTIGISNRSRVTTFKRDIQSTFLGSIHRETPIMLISACILKYMYY